MHGSANLDCTKNETQNVWALQNMSAVLRHNSIETGNGGHGSANLDCTKSRAEMRHTMRYFFTGKIETECVGIAEYECSFKA